MFTLKARKDGYRLLLPKEFIPEIVNEKYSGMLRDAHSFITNPIDLVNESIQRIEVFGFANAAGTVQQRQYTGVPLLDPKRVKENAFPHGGVDTPYRSFTEPNQIVDKTLNIEFRHQLGYINYMIIFESFMYQYSRDYKTADLPHQFNIDLLTHKGSIYSRVVLYNPVMDAMDMLSFDTTQPIAESSSFRAVWKYANFDYQLIDPMAE